VEGRKREVTGGTAQRGSLFLGFLVRIRTFSKKPSSMKATYHATILFSVLNTPRLSRESAFHPKRTNFKKLQNIAYL
jgi:hypothetical protein